MKVFVQEYRSQTDWNSYEANTRIITVICFQERDLLKMHRHIPYTKVYLENKQNRNLLICVLSLHTCK